MQANFDERKQEMPEKKNQLFLRPTRSSINAKDGNEPSKQ
jgi:hypothetical protein